MSVFGIIQRRARVKDGSVGDPNGCLLTGCFLFFEETAEQP